MYESSGSQFFRIRTGIQLGSDADAFDESRLVMIFLIILGVTEIWNFRLVLEDKMGRETPKSSGIEVFEKFLANNFPVSDL